MGRPSIIYVFVFGVLFSCQNKEDIIFFDDFEAESLNTKYWNYEQGDGCPNLCGWGNNERQIYTKENIELRDGNLIIKATKAEGVYRSGRITTKDKVEFKYGSIEMKAKLPLGEGLWPAFWMLGFDIDEIGWPACGEIDIMEYVGKKPNEIHTTLHTTDSYGESKNTEVTIREDIENGFHTYKAEWSNDAISFFIDDVQVYVFSPEDKNKRNWPFDKPFYVILNLAIGGNFGGPYVDDSIFPQEFVIDYVKIKAL